MTGRRDDHPDDQQDDRPPGTAEGRPANDDPRRSTDGAGASWRNRESTPSRDTAANERQTATVTPPVVDVIKAGGRFVVDALTLGLWVIFLTLLFLETNWPQWAFYGLLLGGVAIYVSITVPWTGRSRSTE